jgi:phage/plasmid primase-like uncharacterized protein
MPGCRLTIRSLSKTPSRYPGLIRRDAVFRFKVPTMFILENSDVRVDIAGPEYAPAALRQMIGDTLGNDPGEILADGAWHKIRTAIDVEKGRTGCGSYRLDPTGPVAVFGSHRPGEADYRAVVFDFPGRDSEAWQATAERLKRETAEHLAAVRNEAAGQALATYQAGQPLTGEHAYLAVRGVAGVAIQFGKLWTDAAGALLIPMADTAGTLRNLQTIQADGTKRYITGGETSGLFLGIPARPQANETFYIAEGLAKSLAVWMATGRPTICAFSSGNLPKVAAELDAGRAIVAADGDTAGREAAESCKVLGCRVIYPPDGAGDWNDILTREGLDRLRQLLTTAPAEGPLPLYREPLPAAPYPLDALGELGRAAAVVCDQVGCSPALAGTAFLASANLAAHGLADVHVNHSLTVPLSLFLLSFSESGTGKTPADRMAFAPHRRIEAGWIDAHADDLETVEAIREEREAAIAAVKKPLKSAKVTAAEIRAAVAELEAAQGPLPDVPPEPVLMLDDVTLEGLTRQFREGIRPAVGTVSDEAGRILGGWSMNAENAARTLSGLSKFWDGDTVKIARGTGEQGLTVLRNRRLMVYWASQPATVAKVFADPVFYEQGFLPRCLLIRPDITEPKPVADADMLLHQDIAAHHARIDTLLNLPLATREGRPLELEPRKLGLSADARPRFFALWNQIKLGAGPSGPYADARAYAAKAHDNLLRIAGTLTLYHEPQATEIPTVWLHGAARLIEFYIAEFQRIRHGAEIAAPLSEARKLLNWLDQEGRDHIYPRLIYQYGPNSLRSKEAAKKVIATLADHNHLIPVPGGLELDGAHRRDVWKRIRETAA